MENIMVERILVALINSAIILLSVIIVGYLLQQFRVKFQIVCCKLFGEKVGSFIANRLTFVGTMHHELSHALLATITGAKVTEIHLIKMSGDTLGSVNFIPRGHKVFKNIQYCMAALAPVLCGFVSLFLMFNYINLDPSLNMKTWQWIAVIYIEVSIFLHMTLSKADMDMAVKGMPTVMIIIFFIMYITKIDFIKYFQHLFS